MAAIVVADTSAWIDFLAGRPSNDLEDGLRAGNVVLTPIIVSELLSGAITPKDRETVGDLLQDVPVHETPLEHWINVGDLRRLLRSRGVHVSTPDAHIAQCALELDALLVTRDAVFKRIAAHTRLRLSASRGG